MKRGIIFGVLILIILGSSIFVSADIPILEVDETSPLGVQKN